MSSSFAFIEIYSHNLHNNKKSQFGLGFKFFFYKLYYGFDILWWACRLNISKLIYIYWAYYRKKKCIFFARGKAYFTRWLEARAKRKRESMILHAFHKKLNGMALD